MTVVDDVKDKLDVVDVISGYVDLRKSGRIFKSLCPFHSEKTPSFVVDADRQSWRCFGACATGGDLLSFVMRKEGMGFGDALRILADKAGVELRPKAEIDRTDVLFRVNKEAARFYQDILSSDEGAGARRYLGERKIDIATSNEFQLGLSPKGGTALKEHLSSLGYELENAVKAGLLRLTETGELRDFFWGRLMFPINDRRGRIAGFGARTLDGSDPKYINTPSTTIFDKRTMLYGLDLAAIVIREKTQAVVVEGYMDVIAAHQHGYKNVIASMGTALTEQQVRQLKSLAGRFILALDPDLAGQEATLRSLESSWRVVDLERSRSRDSVEGAFYRKNRLDLRIASLPPTRDPDALIREDPSVWDQALAEAVPFMEFYIPAIVSRYEIATPEGKQDAVTALSSAISSTSNAFEQDKYFNLLADQLGVSRTLLEASIKRSKSTRGPIGQNRRRQQEETAFLADRRDYLEDYALALLIRYPDLKRHEGRLDKEYFHRTENRELFTELLSSPTIEEMRQRLDDTLNEHLDGLSQLELSPIEPWPADEAFCQAAERLQQRHLKERQVIMLSTDDVAVPPTKDKEEDILLLNAGLKDSYGRSD